MSNSSAVQKLEAVVQTQPGAVVSRTLIKKQAGTVTAFAFDAGEGLSEHTTPFEALLIGAEGEAEIRIGGEPHRVGAGDMLTLPANRPHAVKALSAFKMLLIMIRE